MEPPGPARLYAAAVGALLVVLGVVGFFYDASFGALDSYEEALGMLPVNGWLNLLYIATGAVGVLVAGASSRGYALAIGALYVALAIVGWGGEGLNIVIGLLGLGAAAASPRPERRRSKPRAKPAGQRP